MKNVFLIFAAGLAPACAAVLSDTDLNAGIALITLGFWSGLVILFLS
jgi:hypothetical protein